MKRNIDARSCPDVCNVNLLYLSIVCILVLDFTQAQSTSSAEKDNHTIYVVLLSYAHVGHEV